MNISDPEDLIVVKRALQFYMRYSAIVVDNTDEANQPARAAAKQDAKRAELMLQRRELRAVVAEAPPS